MNIIEKADKYADGKVNEAISKIVAQAYIDGYRDGYRDREQEIPADFRDNKTEYVDLGLPSRTLWSSNYEKDGNSYLYLPYERAEYYKIPTIEQWEELQNKCQWQFEYAWHSGNLEIAEAICIGPNGNLISFIPKGRIEGEKLCCSYNILFWIESDEIMVIDIYNDRDYMSTSKRQRNAKISIHNCFPGFKSPVRLVR